MPIWAEGGFIRIPLLKEVRGKMSRKFIFTNKDYSPKSILSTVLGLIDTVSLCYVVYLTYCNGGVSLPRYGSTALLIMVFSFVGLILGILSRLEPDRFYFFSYLGILFNILALAGISLILFAGAYGI